MHADIKMETLRQLAEVVDQQIPFHNLLDMRVKQYDLKGLEMTVMMRTELVGNIHQNILHGGVTASVLDVVGGFTAFASLIDSRDDWNIDELKSRVKTLSTIDLRIDYLRPGRGEVFTGTGTVIRAGNRVSVCRMELHNERGDHIAFGTGTYMVG
ncbi:thioesterase family protein [Shewanella surugensis]|uniref:Medium/long-chain acyl-CoA thioesterase YigI n=1 Tax=Shewanella surugensis TaxID=212020 RepID=A0ABT0L7D2_9GAMM|nr:thioesterase family protein [Shewanella surugensis]MCL1123581.1 thioesterase family protein [Shewanella surugensis]